jgi:hypothetical protein
MTRTTVFGISFDAHDAAKVAQFWADTLGRQVADGADAHDAAVVPSDLVSAGPRLAFHQVPDGVCCQDVTMSFSGRGAVRGPVLPHQC